MSQQNNMFSSRRARACGCIEFHQSECRLLGHDSPVSPFKVEIITTRQNCPPDTADVLLGSVDSKFMEAFQCQVLLLWD